MTDGPSGPYGQYPWPAWPQPLPKHPASTTAMVLGIVAVAAGVALTCTCGIGVLLFGLGPVAWYLGGKAVREIDAAPQRYGGRSEASTGRVLGIVATVLLILSVLAIIAFVVLLVSVPEFREGFDSEFDESYTRLLRG